MDIRKIVTIREQVSGTPFVSGLQCITRTASAAVIKNPFAGRQQEDLSLLFQMGGELGERLMTELVSLLPQPAVSYGKGALVGASGEMEHGGALVHPRLGKPMRAAVNGGKALIPSNVKLAVPGTAIDVPLGHKDEAWSFAHIDTMTIMLADAPLADELVMIMVVADGGRVDPRVGDGPITD